MEEIEVSKNIFNDIENVESHVNEYKEFYLSKGIVLSTIKIKPHGWNQIEVICNRELTEELKEEIRIKKEADLIKQQERLKALSEKMSKAAKKGWIKRHERETKEREKRNEAARKYAEKQLIKRQAKEAEKLRIQQEKDFLHKLLYEEE